MGFHSKAYQPWKAKKPSQVVTLRQHLKKCLPWHVPRHFLSSGDHCVRSNKIWLKDCTIFFRYYVFYCKQTIVHCCTRGLTDSFTLPPLIYIQVLKQVLYYVLHFANFIAHHKSRSTHLPYLLGLQENSLIQNVLYYNCSLELKLLPYQFEISSKNHCCDAKALLSK